MKNERDAEHERVMARQCAEQAAANEKRSKIEDVGKQLSALFGMDDKPQERGKLLEAVLNNLFKAYGLHVREDFRRKAVDSNVVLEQIDGVIKLTPTLHKPPAERFHRTRCIFFDLQPIVPQSPPTGRNVSQLL